MKAPKLKEGMTIGIFSPSTGISAIVPERYERGVRYLESRGFKVKHGSLYGKNDFYRSGTIRERADEFNALLHDEQVDILMSSIGGNNSNSILPYIDYEYIRKHPKIIVGYSDVTAILLGIYAKTGLITFYGPAAAASFGEFPPYVDETYESFRTITTLSKDSGYRYPMPEFWTDQMIDWKKQDGPKDRRPNEWITIRKGVAEGRLIGGNLNTMEGFFGTGYMPEIKEGDILMLEDTQKTASAIEREFSLLKLSGVLDMVSGIIIGKHELFKDQGSGKKHWEIFMEVFGERDIPILAEFDSCHCHPMLTLPIGCRVRLDAGKKTVELLESPVED